jgi:hypothetical protein
LRDIGCKFELESLHALGDNYFIDVWLASKLGA